MTVRGATAVLLVAVQPEPAWHNNRVHSVYSPYHTHTTGFMGGTLAGSDKEAAQGQKYMYVLFVLGLPKPP